MNILEDLDVSDGTIVALQVYGLINETQLREIDRDELAGYVGTDDARQIKADLNEGLASAPKKAAESAPEWGHTR